MEMTANFSTFAFTFWDVSSVPSTRDHTHEFFVLGMLAQSRKIVPLCGADFSRIHETLRNFGEISSVSGLVQSVPSHSGRSLVQEQN
jgi:hypothetical protein